MPREPTPQEPTPRGRAEQGARRATENEEAVTKPDDEPKRLRSMVVPDALWEEAGQIAKAQGISRSELIRRGLMREIAWGKKRAMARAVRKAAK